MLMNRVYEKQDVQNNGRSDRPLNFRFIAVIVIRTQSSNAYSVLRRKGVNSAHRGYHRERDITSMAVVTQIACES